MVRKKEEDESNFIVIASDNCEKALYVIAKAAMIQDTVEIRYINKYAPTIEYLLRVLRKAFGWIEDERGIKEVENTRCLNYHKGECTLEKKGKGFKCNEQTRRTCSDYKKKYNDLFTVNFVTIEKSGGIRGL